MKKAKKAIKEALQKEKISITQFARMMGVTRQNIYGILDINNESEISKANIFYIAHLLGLDLDEMGYDAIEFNSESNQGSDFSGVLAQKQDFSERHLKFINFAKCKFLKIDFTKSRLSYANFDFAFINKTTWIESILKGSSFNKSDIRQCNFEKADLKRSSLTSSNIYYSDFRNSDLIGADLTESSFNNCDMRYANFENVDFTRSKFNNCDLRHANFEGSDLLQTEFNKTDLSHVNLKGVKNSNTCSLIWTNIKQVLNPPVGFVEWALENDALDSDESFSKWKDSGNSPSY